MAEGPNFRRAYFECRYGQLHCRNAFPSTGGFDERVPLVLLHDVPGSAASLRGLMPDFGADRSVYAPDLPGIFASDPPASEPALTEYAGAIADMLRGLRLREVDVLGQGIGAAVAAELAILAPERVRRLVLAGLPGAGDAGHAALLSALTPDGDTLGELWRRLPGELPARTALLAGVLGDGLPGRWPIAAFRIWRGPERLALVPSPTLLLYKEAAPGRAPVPKARSAAVADLTGASFLAEGSRAAREVRRFLDG
jgi:pimeloyl-ACP methyl ester carboxylesterase